MIEAPEGYTPIVRIHEGLEVRALRHALADNPDLWNQRTERTQAPDSPHHGLDDIWARYGEDGTAQPDGSFDSMWYPPALVLPVSALVFPLMAAVFGTRLGGVLVTRIRAGQSCKPHVDEGWHARYYQKFAIQIDAHESQAFHFAGHSLVTKPGDVFWFDNAFTHWVTNDGPFDRITLIACIRTERN
jgi:Aspartyl/Asparaginyl beta-hydroxylase